MKHDSSILIVDDDPTILDVYTELLRASDYHTTPCASVKAAKEYISSAERIDLIIADFWLGDGTAIDVVNHVRKTGVGGGKIQFIVFSGGGGSTSLEEVTAITELSGIATVLYKPLRREDLVASIESLLSD